MNKYLLRPCPICNALRGDVLHTQKFKLPEDSPLPDEYDIVSCLDCGFSFADTAVKQQSYDAYYKLLSKYEDKNTSSGGGYNELDSKRIDVTVEELARICPNKESTIIDIGCASGGILKKLKERGYIALTGIDPSKKCVDDVKNNGINCKQGSIFEANKLIEQKFDCVILSHVIEHIYDLKRAFTVCSKLLNDNGQLYVEVPNAASYADYYVVPFYYFDCEHINHFDETSLINMGEATGFSKKHTGHKIVQVSENQQYPALFVVFEKSDNKEFGTIFVERERERERERKRERERERVSVSAKESILRYVEQSIKNSQIDILSRLAKTQEEIYVFGAGNYTLRLLASTDLSRCNIKAFIDNDTNKQGRVLENRPIVTPEILQQFIGKVIVCSALFAKEIVEQISLINPDIQSVVVR